MAISIGIEATSRAAAEAETNCWAAIKQTPGIAMFTTPSGAQRSHNFKSQISQFFHNANGIHKIVAMSKDKPAILQGSRCSSANAVKIL